MIARKTKSVIVIGAGIAGLTAAYRLGRSGHKVTVLETQSRTGGRALTLRSLFPDDLVAQAGPARIPGDCKRVIWYADKFGLRLSPFYPGFGKVVAYLEGNRLSDYKPTTKEFWGYVAPTIKERRGISALLLRAAKNLYRLTRRSKSRPVWMTYGITGGSELLTEAMMRAAVADFRLNTTVKSVVQDSAGVRIGCVTQEGEESLNAEYVICAVPLSVLKKLDFFPACAPEKESLLRTIPFSSAIRIFVQMSRPYWRDEGHNGFAITDTLGEVWDPHHEKDRGTAMLVCYAQDELARRLGAMTESDRLDHALNELELIFPGAKDHFIKGASYSWDEQPWIGGGWPLMREGFSEQMSVFRKPDGRVYFAGDYAALPAFPNTMEGAIESGELAADQIESAV